MRTRRNGRARFALAAFALSAAASVVRADDYRTPHAGEVAVGTIFGNEVRAPKRDRGRITYLNLGAVLLSGGPDGLGFGPAGGAYFWRAPEEGESRLRAIFAGISNEVRRGRCLHRPKRSYEFAGNFRKNGAVCRDDVGIAPYA